MFSSGGSGFDLFPICNLSEGTISAGLGYLAVLGIDDCPDKRLA